MLGLFGYNFLADGNAADPAPTNIAPINDLKISNGIYNHLTLLNDGSNTDSQIPSSWVAGMLLNAGFHGNLAAGSLEDVAGSTTGYKVKRRKLGDFDWITIAEEKITSLDQLSFTIRDYLNQAKTEYEYAFVPMMDEAEGSYIISTIVSDFNGVFFTDGDTSVKLEAGVSYGSTETNQKVGIYEPFGRKYPVVVTNGVTSYDRGSVSGTILPEDYDPKKPLQRMDMINARKKFVDFINNRRPKIFKDWNGRMLIVFSTENVSTDYAQGSGMGLMNVNVGWTEVGDSNDRQDLYDSGLIPTAD